MEIGFWKAFKVAAGVLVAYELFRLFELAMQLYGLKLLFGL